jgi:predicted ArsR family transcriptional regulator
MDGQPNDPRRQLAAAWQAATAALGEWRKQVAAATNDAMDKLDPAVRAAVEAARAAVTGDWGRCHCPCSTAHPEDKGVCDGRAVMARRLGEADVSLCAPCAVAQGVAEWPVK